MASRTLLKLKINPNLPLRFLRNTTSVLTRPVNPVVKSEAPGLFFNTGSTFMFDRGMGTSRSSSTLLDSSWNDEEDDDNDDGVDMDEVDFDRDEDIELDDDGDKFDDGEYEMDDDDDDEEEEEEEEPRKKKSYGKK